MAETKKKKTIGKIISDTIFGIFMGILGCFVVLSILEKTVNFSIGGNHIVWVLSPSMEPTIPAHSYILVKDCTAKDVQVNDVIMFISEDPAIKGQKNTHRVIEIKENGEFVTKGDNNPFDDGIYSAKPENVVAKYKANLPFLSIFGRLNASPAGLVLTCGLSVGLIGVWFALDIRDKKKLAKKELMEKMVQDEVNRLQIESKNYSNKERSNIDGKEN